VTATAGCAWKAALDVSWAAIVSGGGGTGAGSIRYRVDGNQTFSTRTGRLLVTGANQSTAALVLDQASAVPAECGFGLSSTAQSVDASGGKFQVDVLGNCAIQWQAASDVPWLTLVSATSGTTPGSIAYTVAVNASSSTRVGHITVRLPSVNEERQLTVTQAPGSATYRGTLVQSPVARFSASACAYTQEFRDVAATLTVADSTITGGNLTATGIERVTGCTAKPYGATAHSYVVSGGVVKGTLVQVQFRQSGGAPSTDLTFSGTLSGGRISGTLRWRRILQSGEPESLAWEIVADFTLLQQ
jgi:hypothetical protein